MLANSRGALVVIQARDFERAVTFYTDVLGLDLSFRRESLWAEVRAPGLSLGIEAASDGTVVGGGSTAVVFEVRDIARIAEVLRSRGVAFLGPIEESFHGKTASFLDSEGNLLVLHQSLDIAEEPRRRPGKASAARGGAKKSAGAKKKKKARVPAKAKKTAKAKGKSDRRRAGTSGKRRR